MESLFNRTPMARIISYIDHHPTARPFSTRFCPDFGIDKTATQLYNCVVIPDFETDGLLPPGVHWATWQEFSDRFGTNEHRKNLLSGLTGALISLKAAGCQTVYVDGSFVTNKEIPGDFDACWDPVNVDPRQLDPVLLKFDHGRATQKAKYRGELFISTVRNGNPGPLMLEFFQSDKNSGKKKGIIAIDLRRLP